jgi:hypothetical protein
MFCTKGQTGARLRRRHGAVFVAIVGNVLWEEFVVAVVDLGLSLKSHLKSHIGATETGHAYQRVLLSCHVIVIKKRRRLRS